MPKRKRSSIEQKGADPTQEIDLRKNSFEKKLVYGRKLLNRALKTAKGFERQKLGKRIKLAAEKNDDAESVRLQRELDVLIKTIDVSKLAEVHLHKTLVKSKDISGLNLLPENIKTQTKKDDLSVEEKLAVDNVTARMYNTKPVKEAMSLTMNSIYAVLGISNPNMATRKKAVAEDGIIQRDLEKKDKIPQGPDIELEVQDPDGDEKEAGQEPAGKGVEPGSDSGSNSGSNEFSRYDGLLGGSSDENDVDVDNAESARSTTMKKALKRSRSSSISISQSSRPPSPPPRPKKSKKQSEQASTKPGSTFLPSLMGGYWSGSETATDDEGVAPPPRKNRRGQQARRAIWEKKYGTKAKHLQSGAPVKSRNKDWDPKRGARGPDDRGPKRGRQGSRGNSNASGRRIVQSTSENSVPVKPRARGTGKKDDAGPLHPSWEAAKKAKEAKKSVAFEGKKVVFN